MARHFTRGVSASQNVAATSHSEKQQELDSIQEEDEADDVSEDECPSEDEHEDMDDEGVPDMGLTDDTDHNDQRTGVQWRRINTKDYANNNDTTFSGAWEEGHPSKYVRQQHVNSHSPPILFFLLFWPVSLFEDILDWTNAKLRKTKDDKPDAYKDVKEFKLIQILRFFAILIKHGCCPMPGLFRRFLNTATNFFWGDDRDIKVMGSNAQKKVQWMRVFMQFAPSDHDLSPEQLGDPVRRCRPLLTTILENCLRYWVCGKWLSIDEQTIFFRGNWQHKKRITYKRFGDGFHVDTLCDDGYTFGFMFRCEIMAADPRFPNASQLHLRCLWLLSLLKNYGHRVVFDRFFISYKFIVWALTEAANRTLVGGTARKDRIPNCVKVNVPKSKSQREKLRMKIGQAAVSQDDVLAFGLYDQGDKACYFMGNIRDDIEFIHKERTVWRDGAAAVITFLRTSVQDVYNFCMNQVDKADQYRQPYRPDASNNMRNRKWTWPVAMWALGVAMVNAYTVYKSLRGKDGLPVMSNADFRQAIAVGLIGDISDDCAGQGDESKKRKRSSVPGATKDMQRLAREGKNNPLYDRETTRISGNSAFENQERRRDLGSHQPEVILHSDHRRCQLCWWQGVNKRAKMICSTCRKQLCLNCWIIWHSSTPLPPQKND